MNDLVSALRAVVGALEDSRVDYLLVGSTAAAAWGVIRTTRDVDLVAVLDQPGLADLLARLDPKAFYVPPRDAAAAVERLSSFNVIHTSGGGKVDLFVASAADEFTSSRLRRRRRLEVLGVQAWVATPEDIVLAKLRWRLESRSEQQWRDCVELVAINDLDWQYLLDWGERLNVAADLAELAETRP